MEDDILMLGALGLVLCSYAAIKIQRKKRQQRRFKVRPINRERRLGGNFQYYQKMKSMDAGHFFKYTRMILPVFEELLTRIRPSISRCTRTDGIIAEERLVLTLQYLSQGTSMQALAWSFNMGLTTVHQIIHETCTAIWNILSCDYLKSPSSEEEWITIAKGFETRWNFPHCLGALDGKHIQIQAPARSGSLYFNYKKTFSIVLLAACDSRYLFTLVDIGAYGSQSDGGIHKNSVFGERLERKNMNIPHGSILKDTNITLPYFLVADEAFPLKEFIMRPYPGRNLTMEQRIFNYRLSRARQCIENTFGILVTRWRILKTSINAKVENIDNIVKAVVVLHNFCKIKLDSNSSENLYCTVGYVDSNDEENGTWRTENTHLGEIRRLGSNVAKRALYTVRDLLCQYFISDIGKVAWQEAKVNQGRQNE